MTDKEILIDGIDVSGCEFYIDNYKYSCDLSFTNKEKLCSCNEIDDCYYKQLKRLEAEHKNLREAMHNDFCSYYVLGECSQEHHNNCVGRNQCIKDLEAENARLKEEIKTFEDKLQLRMASDKESDAFWDDIFSEKDYPFNKENAYKELRDYYFVLEQLPKIYMEITGGTLSKTTYFASSVIEAYNDSLDRYYDEIDDLEYNNNAYKTCLQKIKEIASRVFPIGAAINIKDIFNDYKQILNLINESEDEE